MSEQTKRMGETQGGAIEPTDAELELAGVPRPDGGRPLSTTSDPSVASMLQAVIDKGVTTESVGALEKLVGLYERMQQRDSERLFNEAFSKLQSEMPAVEATQPVPNRDGTVRYKFAPFPDIMEVVQEHLTKNGFSVSFNSRIDETRMTVICTLRHISGHSQSNEFSVRIGAGPPGATDTQADGSAKTYAKRGALCDALNIVVEKDDDAAMLGKPIGKALGDDLQARVKACGANEEAFLRFAGAVDYETIPDSRYEICDEFLKRKESKVNK